MLLFVRRSRRVAVAFFAVLALSTLSFNFDVLLPLLAGETLEADADVFGLMAAVFGAGALCGALFLATLGKARIRLVLGGALGFGVLELALAPQESLGPICVLLFLTGGCYLLWGASALASLQLAAPEHLRGQAASLYFFAFLGGAPVGGLLAGWLTARGGTQLAFAVAGTGAVVVAVTGAVVMLVGRPARNARPTIRRTREGLTVNRTYSYTHCRFGVATRDVTPPVGIYARSLGGRDARRGRGRPPPVRRHGRRLRAARRGRADAGAGRGRPRLVPAHAGRAQAARDDSGSHRAGRRRAADQHVAHTRRREHQLASWRTSPAAS